jgi:phosphatidylethanolamine-binding protein
MYSIGTKHPEGIEEVLQDAGVEEGREHLVDVWLGLDAGWVSPLDAKSPAGELPSGSLVDKEAAHSKIVVEASPLDNRRRYVILLVDPDAPSRHHLLVDPDAPSHHLYYLHWLVDDARLGERNQLRAASAVAYAGPSPPAGTGVHRYVLLVLIKTHAKPVSEPQGRTDFNLASFVHDNGLVTLGANFFTVSGDSD